MIYVCEWIWREREIVEISKTNTWNICSLFILQVKVIERWKELKGDEEQERWRKKTSKLYKRKAVIFFSDYHSNKCVSQRNLIRGLLYTGIYFTRDNLENREKRWHMFRYFKTFRYNPLIGRYSSSVQSHVGERAKKK